MVNYGRSAACITCKQRKVKCDETRPGCRKCKRIGKSCPGYPDDWELTHRNENQALAKKVGWTQDTRPALPTAKKLLLDNALVDERLHAISLFFDDYTIKDCAPCPGYLQFLPRMYHSSRENSLLHHAVCTAAYANFAQKTDRTDLAIMAMSHYRESLEIINRILLIPDDALNDATMTAVLLLGVYECINSTLIEAPYQHIVGLETLADLRGSLLMQGYGPNILQIVCCQMQRRNLDQRVAPSPADERLVNQLNPQHIASQMIINQMIVSKFVANVDAKIRSRQVSPNQHDILQNFNHVERKLMQWDEAASQELFYVQVKKPDSLETYHTYPGFWSLSLWNKHRASRILVHATLLKAFSESSSSPTYKQTGLLDETRYKVSQSIIQEMADDIFTSMPFSFGDIPLPNHCNINGPKSVGGYFLIWSLQVVLQCEYVDAGRREVAKEGLLRVGRQCGISYATIFANNFQHIGESFQV